MKKIKWEVMPAPTGRYRSFQQRGWPWGLIDDELIFTFDCKDDYEPRLIKTGSHATISMVVRVDGKRMRFKDTFATLAEAKLHAQTFVNRYPEKFEKK